MNTDLQCKRDQSIYETVLRSAQKFPRNIALRYMHHKYTYRHMLKRINQFADSLKELGIEKDEPVTVCLPNIPDAVYLLYAINQIGAIANLVHPLFNLHQMEENIELVKSKIIFCLDLNYEQFLPLKEKGITLIACSPAEELNIIEKTVYHKSNSKALKMVTKDVTTHRFYKAKVLTEFDPRYKCDAIYLHSGGTSGKAKTIALSSFSLNALDWNGAYILDLDSAKNQAMFAVLPMFHGFGLCMGIHAMLAHGGTDVIMPKFSSKDTIKYIKRNQIQFLIGIPILYQALLDNKKFNGKMLKNLNIAFVGGDFVSSTLLNTWNDRMKEAGSRCRLREGYGLTETVTVCCVNTHLYHEDGTVGRPLPNIKFKIVDHDTGKDLPSGSEGELYVAGETLMNGYRFSEDPKANENVFVTDKDGVVWVKTGDFCYLTPTGYLVFKQRIKRIIKVNGIPVFPSMVEDSAKKLSFVYEVAAIGVPDTKRGSMIKLFVSLDRNVEVAKEDAIEQLNKVITDDLGIYSKPKEIVFLDKMPHTMVGKVDVKQLK